MKRKKVKTVLGIVLSAFLLTVSTVLPVDAAAGNIAAEMIGTADITPKNTAADNRKVENAADLNAGIRLKAETASETETASEIEIEMKAETLSETEKQGEAETASETPLEMEGIEPGDLEADMVAGDNVYPARSTGAFYIQAVYSGGSRSGQYDKYSLAVSNVNTSVNINTIRNVKVTASYSGNASGSLITGMGHTPTTEHAALYCNKGGTSFLNSYNYLYTYFRLTVPTGYRIAAINYTGQGSRGTLHHLYLDNANLQFNTASGVKTWNSSTANLLTSACAATGEAQSIAVRSMVDIFYNAGVGTTSSSYVNAHGKVTQSVVISPVSYTLSYHANGGTGAPAPQTLTYDTAAVISAGQPQRPGYQFAGWSIGGTEYNAGQSLSAAQVSTFASRQGAVVTAYARWEPIQYSITYDGNGATEGSTANQDALSYGVSYHLQPNGYKKQYEITYDLQGGTLENPINTVAARFLGWTTKDNAVFFENNAVISNLASKSETVVLYAKWDDAPLTVQLPVPVKEAETVAAQNSDGKSGYNITTYQFAGWKKSGSEEVLTNQPQTINENVRLTAEWNEETVFYENMPSEDTAGQILNKLDVLQNKLTNGYNLTDEQAEKILEAIEDGSAFVLTMDDTRYTIVRNGDGTLTIQLAAMREGAQKISIPSEVKIGEHIYTITEIYKECFKNNTSLKEVTMGNNIAKIGDSAFAGCTGLQSVNLAEGLVSIGEKAFDGCISLKSIKTPETLQIIGSYAFRGCTALKSVTLNDGLLTIGKYAFYKCKMIEKITIPDTVLQIGKYAFAKCEKIKTAATSKACTTIGEGVFSDCISLKKIVLKAALTEVPKKAFQNCIKMTSVKMENKVTAIGAKAFYGCKSLKSVKLSTSLTTIGKQAFMNCKKLACITIPKKVMTIREKAFYQCSGMKKVKLESMHLTSVGKDTFKKCKKGLYFSVPADKKSAYAKLLKGKY